MLLETERCSLNRNAAEFNQRRKAVSPLVISRPRSLHFFRANEIHDSLPSTPESPDFRERSYCSLPDKSSEKSTKKSYRPISCVITQRRSLSGSFCFESSREQKKKFGTHWVVSRCQSLMKTSAVRRAATVKCDARSRKNTWEINRQRRAASVQSFPGLNKEDKLEWSEERHDDVIYAVKLKRTRSHANTDGSQWETHRVRHIKGATFEYAVSHLCKAFTDDWEERNFFTIFFTTYRTFATAEAVLDQIIKESERLISESAITNKSILRSIEKVLRTWLERYFYEDFYEPPNHELLMKLKSFAENYKLDGSLESSFASTTRDNENSRDFLSFVNSKWRSAEEKSLQEQIFEEKNTPSCSSDLSSEIDDVCFEDELNLEAARCMIDHFTPAIIAEQLTVKDANLFLCVVPHHCLKAVRSCKQKPASLQATIHQFNKVVYCVLGTCLSPSLKSAQRVKIFCKWIEVAQLCRELKNFSSLRAIVSGLQTHALHRLKRTWQHVSHYHIELLRELEEINMKDLIMKVGTAKVNTDKSAISRVRKDSTFRLQRDIHSGIMHGTVPYLGSFLTDLTYLHTAKPDFIEKGMVNFNKRHQEFELLAQLQLWQASCRSYQHFEYDRQFIDWFNSVTLPTDEQAISLSEQIEPPHTIPLPSTPLTPFKKTITEILGNYTGDFGTSGSSSSTPLSVKPKRNGDNEFRIFDGISMTNYALQHIMPPRLEQGDAIATDATNDEERLVHVQVIKKQLEGDQNICVDQKHDEKVIKLSSNDRSPAFMKRAMELFDMNDENLQNFSLKQLLPDDKDLSIPDNGNVFYAMNSSTAEFKFVLLEEGAEIPRSPRTQTLPRPNRTPKLKKHNRVTRSVSSMMVKQDMSSKKHLYQFALGGLSLTTGSYAIAQDLQKKENTEVDTFDVKNVHLQDDKPPQHLCVARDDSVICTAHPHSDHSGYESDCSSWSCRIQKMIPAHRKKHRRKHSNKEFEPSNSSKTNTMNLSKNVSRINSASTFPAKMMQSMIISTLTQPRSSKNETPSSSEEDATSDCTCSSNQVAPPKLNRAKVSRRSAFRKQEHPAIYAGRYRRLTDTETETLTKETSPCECVTESLGKNIGQGQILDESTTAYSLVSTDSLNESEGDDVPISSLYKDFDTSSRVWSGDRNRHNLVSRISVPTITVQSPSPVRMTSTPKSNLDASIPSSFLQRTSTGEVSSRKSSTSSTTETTRL